MIIYPSNVKSIANVYSAFERYFGMKPNYSCLRKIEQLLKEEEYKNIIILNYNGLSTSHLDNLSIDSILVKNLVYSTTVAPYSFDSDVENIYNKFGNKLVENINLNTDYNAYGIFPYGLGAYRSTDEAYQRIINLSSGSNKKVIYASFEDLVEANGLNLTTLKNKLESINDSISSLADSIQDSLIFIVSNFGSVVKRYVNFADYPDILDLIKDIKYININSCFIKMEDSLFKEFKMRLVNEFGNSFLVLSRKVAIERNLLKEDSEFFGNYLIVSVSDIGFISDISGNGLSKEEAMVPIIAIKKKPYREEIRRSRVEDYEVIIRAMRDVQRERFKVRRDIFLSLGGLGRLEFSSLCDRTISNNCFVYDINGKIAGFIITKIKSADTNGPYLDHDYFTIQFLYVFEEYRRKGIGTKLYKEAVRYAKKLHFTRVEIPFWYIDKDIEKFIAHLEPHLLHKIYEFYI